MNKRLVPLAVLSLLLGGCGWLRPDPGHGARPQVQISGDQIKSVTPDPLRFRPDQGAIVITWGLPDGDYSFARNGIVVDGEVDRPGGKLVSREQREIVDCKPLEQGRQFQCIYRNTRPGTFKYSVRVLRQGKALAPLDPEITNMD